MLAVRLVSRPCRWQQWSVVSGLRAHRLADGMNRVEVLEYQLRELKRRESDRLGDPKRSPVGWLRAEDGSQCRWWNDYDAAVVVATPAGVRLYGYSHDMDRAQVLVLIRVLELAAQFHEEHAR